MSCIAYREWRPHKKTKILVAHCQDVISSYQLRGLRMTLRQLYYQLVSRNLIANEEKVYKKLSTLLTDARMAGMIDWDAIEDRHRQPVIPIEFADLNERVELALANYRLDRWEGQENYAELWTEKAAIANVLQPITHEHHAVLMVNRGYSSASAMYEAAQRFMAAAERDQHPILFYVGDLDPSGEDMVRDVRERLAEFGADVDVRKLALNLDQVQKHELPPNPAKTEDKRAPKFIAEFGEFSWEVDALPIDALDAIVRQAFEQVIDADLVQQVIEQEERDRDRLRAAVAGIGGAA